MSDTLPSTARAPPLPIRRSRSATSITVAAFPAGGREPDSKLAGLALHLANHFVQAEVRHFGLDDLDNAVTWASASPSGR